MRRQQVHQAEFVTLGRVLDAFGISESHKEPFYGTFTGGPTGIRTQNLGIMSPSL